VCTGNKKKCKKMFFVLFSDLKKLKRKSGGKTVPFYEPHAIVYSDIFNCVEDFGIKEWF